MKTAIISTDQLIETANAGDGWYRISKYGDFPNRAAMQRVTRENAGTLAANFSGALARVKSWITGGTHTAPSYLGHPDDPVFANTQGHDDTTRYAEVIGVDAREDGIYGHFVFSNAWSEIKSKLPKLYISPRWAVRETARGSGIFTPVKLLSVGLTPTPNMPGTDAVNTGEQPETIPDTMNKAQLLKLLGLGTDATDEQINTAIDAALKTKETADGDLTKAKADLATANSALTAANAATANERTARAAEAVTIAIANGKITAAERASWEAKLTGAGDFVAVSNELAATKPAVKTEPVVQSADQRTAVADAETKFEALVNERAKTTGEDRNTAWVAVSNSAAGKPLIEQMKTAKTKN